MAILSCHWQDVSSFGSSLSRCVIFRQVACSTVGVLLTKMMVLGLGSNLSKCVIIRAGSLVYIVENP